VVSLNRLPRAQDCVRDGGIICCVSFSRVGLEFHFHPPASFFRSELARYGKHLPALGTAPGHGVAINLVDDNQFCHTSSISQSGCPNCSIQHSSLVRLVLILVVVFAVINLPSGRRRLK